MMLIENKDVTNKETECKNDQILDSKLEHFPTPQTSLSISDYNIVQGLTELQILGSAV